MHATTAAHFPMHCLRVPACLAVLLGIVATWSLAEEAKVSLPLASSWSMLLSTQTADIARLPNPIEGSPSIFGSSDDAQTVIRQTYYPLAMGLLRSQKFAEAYQAIEDAFERNRGLLFVRRNR